MNDLSIAAIKDLFKATQIRDMADFIEKYRNDSRTGVQKLIDSAHKKIVAYEKEVDRTETMKAYENSFPNKNYICGIDEVGRGPLAGPVVTAAVILPEDCQILYINDSKQVTAKKREELYDIIMKEAIAVSFGIEGVESIDSINILQATYKAMKSAVEGLSVRPDMILVDAVTIPDVSIEQLAIVKGDEKSISIAAASIVAKVTRDRMMVDYDELFPGYNFTSNKGYGTQVHIDAIREIGPCPIHRSTFIKNFV